MPKKGSEEHFEKLSKIIVKTGAFILLLSILGKGAGYVFNMLLRKSVSLEFYGIFTLAWGIVTFSSGILLLGVPDAISRFVAFYRGKGDKNGVDNSIKTSGFLIVILTFISLCIFLILYKFFPSFLSLKRNEFILVCFLFFVWSLNGFFSAIITGFRKPQISQLIRFFLEILRPIFLFFVILLGISLFSIIFALILAIIVPTLISGIYVAKKFGLRGKIDIKLAKEFLKFGIPMALTSTANNLLGWADMFIVRILLGFSALGIYYIANLTAAVGLVFFSALLAIFTPIVTEHFGRKDTQGASKLSSYLLESFFLLFIPIFIVFISFPKEILVILFTPEDAKGALAFQVMSLSMFLYGTSILFTTILNSSGKPKKVASIVGITAGVNIVADFILIPIFGVEGIMIGALFGFSVVLTGIEGAAIARVLSSLLLLILSYIEVRRVIKLREVSFSRIGKIIFSSILILPLIFLIKRIISDLILSLILSTAVLLFSYVFLIILFKAFRHEDISIIDGILRKLKIPRNINEKVLNFLSKRTIV